MADVPLPEPDISVPFLSEVRKVPQGDYYRADKVLPLLKQWAVLYEAAKAGHEQAFAEAQNAAAVSAAKDAEIVGLRAELLKSLADNAALRAEVAQLRERPKPNCRTCTSYGAFYGRCNLVSPRCTNGDRYQALPLVRLWRTT